MIIKSDASKHRQPRLLIITFFLFLIGWQLLLISGFIYPFCAHYGLGGYTREGEVFSIDFVRYYVAGVMARSVDHLKVYEIPAHLPYMNSFLAPLVITKESVINFSPPMILIMSAVSFLPILWAYALWITSSQALGISAIVLYLRGVRKFSIAETAIFCLIVANSLPSFCAVRTGQWSWWLVTFSIMFCYSYQKRSEVLSGIFLGGLLIKPQFALPLLVVAVTQKRWTTVITAICSFLVLNTAAGLLIGFENVISYPIILSHLEGLPNIGVRGSWALSFRGMLEYLLGPLSAFSASVWLYYLALLLLYLFCSQKKIQKKENEPWLLALAMLVGQIFAPVIFLYDATLICVPAALTLPKITPSKIMSLKPLSLLIWSLSLISYPFISWISLVIPQNRNFYYAFVNSALLICGWLLLFSRTKKEIISRID